MLRSRAAGGLVNFMVYGERFKNGFVKFPFLRIFHLIQIFVVIGGILVANFLIYPEIGINEFFNLI